MTESHTEEPSVVSSSVDVGKRLRDARETKKISITDAAAQLRVTRGAIVNLEEQNWDKLHGRTYARGYFLSYVKFLGLPQDEMLAGFNIEFTETDKRSPSIAPIQQIKPATSGFPWLPLILLLIVAILAWFAYQQWQTTQINNQDDEIFNQPLNQSLEQQEDDTGGNSIPITESNIEQIINADDQPALLNETDESLTVPEPALAEQSPTTIETPENTTAAPEANGDVNQNNLIIGINSDCWVEVRDANQQVLISRVVRGGNTIELTGTTPLQVSLGQANAASVRFDGNIIDITEYTRGNVARFTLGEDT